MMQLESVDVAETVSLDGDDRRVLHALQLDGRASFAQLGAVLGMSERAVSRRYHRLRSQLALRVVGIAGRDPREHEDWFLRITAVRMSIDALARALADRDDTSWIGLLAGDGGLGCILRTPTPGGDQPGPLEQFRRAAGIATVTAQRLLTPIAGVGGWPGRLEALTASERTALAPPRHTDSSSAGGSRSEDDVRLLHLLATDGRMSISRLGRESGIPESTVRRRIAQLAGSGALMFEIEVDPRLYGRQLEVLCWMDVRPDALGDVAAGLGSHSEVAFASTTTGSTAILAILELADADDLHRYLAEQLGALPGIHRVQTEIVTRWIKRAGPLVIPRPGPRRAGLPTTTRP
ncbi:Lrp/AsnC family transcriptional regulator [Kribbella sp. NPDC050124]|uniref:Lrp/AsnC family transcriptional regulator n=1 Tax=Kribbella sp. NPDC050124 TaxID=3364114 RepID=UPI0037AD96AD